MAATASLRARVLDATLAEVGAVGLTALTVEAVATRAGSSRATLYRHFPGGRDELVDATIGREVDRFITEIEEAAGDTADPVAHVSALLLAGSRFLAGHAILQRLLVEEADALLPSLATVQPMVSDAITLHLLGVLDAAADAGRLGPDVHSEAAADHCARMVLSYLGTPGRWDLGDAAAVDRLVRTRILSGVTDVT